MHASAGRGCCRKGVGAGRAAVSDRRPDAGGFCTLRSLRVSGYWEWPPVTKPGERTKERRRTREITASSTFSEACIRVPNQEKHGPCIYYFVCNGLAGSLPSV